MAAGLVLEFEGVGREGYEAVNRLLGIDMESGAGDWPEGLLSHAGGSTDGGWAVLEVWESREAQARFMESGLGAALQQAQLPPPSRVLWADLVAYHTP